MQILVLAREVKNSIRYNGLLPTLGKAFRMLRRQEINAFDRAHPGVDTSGIVKVWNITGADAQVAGARYVATEQEEFEQALTAIPCDFSDYTFIDVGCGKGLTLMLAAKLGFRRIIGVELGKELAEIARVNLARLNISADVINANADTYQFPTGNLVVYLYNPFGPRVMSKVIQSLKRTTEKVWVVYNNPVCSALFDEAGFRLFMTLPAASKGRCTIRIWER
jgi:predicted RNA methylase